MMSIWLSRARKFHWWNLFGFKLLFFGFVPLSISKITRNASPATGDGRMKPARQSIEIFEPIHKDWDCEREPSEDIERRSFRKPSLDDKE